MKSDVRPGSKSALWLSMYVVPKYLSWMSASSNVKSVPVPDDGDL